MADLLPGVTNPYDDVTYVGPYGPGVMDSGWDSYAPEGYVPSVRLRDGVDIHMEKVAVTIPTEAVFGWGV